MRTSVPASILALAAALLAGCAADLDKDGTADEEDCAPSDATIHAEATELCDGIDNNCNGFVDEGVSLVAYWDRDLDGYGSEAHARRVCELPEDGSTEAGDCDDLDPAIGPHAEEGCDGIDQDCDGEIDEGVTRTWYADADGDGRGDPGISVESCEPVEGYADNAEDCDDDSPEAWADRPEQCDGLDNDCDGDVDEGLNGTQLWADADGDAFGDPDSPVVDCGPDATVVDNDEDCDDTDAAIHPDADEIGGNGIDEDCDGYESELAVPEDYATVEEALAASSPGDVVQLAAGHWDLTLDLVGYDITLAGEGCGRTIVYGSQLDSVVRTDGGAVEEMTLAGGYAAYGGGLLVIGEVSARGLCVDSNEATERGGGIAITLGSLYAEDVVVARNSCSSHAGGVYVGPDASLEGLRLQLLDNSSGIDGGGLMVDQGYGELRASVIAGNFADEDGGGVCNSVDGGEFTLLHSTLVGNWADSRGQAVYTSEDSSYLDHVLISDHTEEGDAVYDRSGDTSFGRMAFWNNAGADWRSRDGRHHWLADALREAPNFVDHDPGSEPRGWDLRLLVGSGLIDAGNAALVDPDGTRADMGAYGGPDAGPGFDYGYRMDEDGDGLPDGWEAIRGTNPYVPDATDDPDADGLDNAGELELGSDPNVADTDADGISDGEEATAGADPTLAADQLPVPWAGHDRYGVQGQEVLLDASPSWDPNSDSLSVHWELDAPLGSSLEAVEDPEASSTRFTPDAAGTFVLTLSVDDGRASVSRVLLVRVVNPVIVPDDVASLQEAVDAAESGDAIALRPGTWPGPITLGGRDLVLVGLGEPEEIVIDGQKAGPTITADQGEELLLAQLTLSGGQATSGGGLYAVDGELLLYDVHVRNNLATASGGGLALVGDSATLYGERLRIESNLAPAGGGLWVDDGEAELWQSTLAANQADSEGGGLYLSGLFGAVDLYGVTLQGNQSRAGGGIYLDGGVLYASHPALVDNHAEEGAAALYAADGEGTLWSPLLAFNTGSPVLDRNFGEAVALYPATWNNELDLYGTAEDDPGEGSLGQVSGDPQVALWSDDGVANDLFAPLPGSPLVDAGWPEHLDPDGTVADIGPYGGPGAPVEAPRFLQDLDGDGVSDGWELAVGLDPDDPSDVSADGDGDGLTAAEEYALGTDPDTADSDGDGLSDGEEVSGGGDPLDAADNRPIAVAGEDTRVEAYVPYTLDGSASSDPNGDPLSYTWTFAEQPAGSALTDSDLDSSSSPSFTPDARGTWRVQLVVDDGRTSSLPDTVQITAYGELSVPGDVPTLEEAIATAIDGDTFLLEPGEYEVFLDGDGVSYGLRGAGADQTTLIALPGSSILQLDDGEHVVLEDLRLSGAGGYGGAVDCDESSLEVHRSEFSGNIAYQGGGIRAVECDLLLRDTDFVGNASDVQGGGMYLRLGSLDWSGGEIRDNLSYSTAGGLYISWDGIEDDPGVYLSNLIFADNEAGTAGGAVYQSYGQVVGTNLAVVGNRGTSGAFYSSLSARITLSNSLFAENSARGFYKSGGDVGEWYDTSYNAFWNNEDEAAYPTGAVTFLDIEGVDPRVVDLDARDLRLRADSPLIDAGDPSLLDPDGSLSDIGAYGGPTAPADFDSWYADSDGDGMPDGWELEAGLDPATDDAGDDADGDGLLNLDEYLEGSDPNLVDTDADGLSDLDEVLGGSDPASGDDLRPVADAGDDASVSIGVSASCDGSESSDPNGDPVNYTWTLVDAPGRSSLTTGDLVDASSDTVQLLPDAAGRYILQLSVSDGSSADTDDCYIYVAGDLRVPDDYSTLSEAVDAASDGATIDLPAGTQTGTYNLLGRDLVLRGAGRELSTLDGEGWDTVIVAEAGEDLVLEDLSITGGRGIDGGAIRMLGGDLLLNRVGLIGNDAITGGAVFSDGGRVQGSELRLLDNVATRYGGALYVDEGELQLDRVLAAFNLVIDLYGGAIYTLESDVDIQHIIAHANQGEQGGAFYFEGDDALNKADALVDHLSATWNDADTAGVVRQEYTDLVLSNSILAHTTDGFAVDPASSDPANNAYTQLYSLVYENDPDHWWNVDPLPDPADGNLEDVDPQFVAVDSDGEWSDDDWHLQAGSPAEDAADPAAPVDADDKSPADMGAHGGAGASWIP